ncbi:MAG: NAD(P)H-hydrate dehydratase [Allomuricauda sp.]|nr:MAG: NAD(P)H-hydrate dehydratase [Allomuricauda sp.]
MKIFTAQQIYQADKFTIDKQQISSDQLMENAAVGLFNWIHGNLNGSQVKIHLFCGIGNNGGDGIALARHLKDHGYHIEVHVVNYSEKRSKDFLINLSRLKERKIWPEFIDAKSSLPQLSPNDIIVDAIFGIGLNREPNPWVVQLIQHLNNSRAFILAVDIPSGLYMDRVPKNTDGIIRATHVLSIQFPKLVFFLPQTGIYLNTWEILDIGLDPEFVQMNDAEFEYIERWDVLGLYRPRPKYAHKGTFGHTVIMGGSLGKIGATMLASRAALTIGSGLVTAYVPECGLVPLQTALPEVMVLTDSGEAHIQNMALPFTPTAIAIGMGLGTGNSTAGTFETFLEATESPLVLDADAINLLAANPKSIKKIPKNSVLTPHPKELERLVGSWTDDFDKIQKAKAFSKTTKSILVVKGAHTLVIHGEKGYVNSTGNPGMATAGSGDVLAGMIAGLMAQGYEAIEATIFGVYLHGLAGDIAAHEFGYEATLSSSIIDAIGDAYKALFQREEPPEQVKE